MHKSMLLTTNTHKHKHHSQGVEYYAIRNTNTRNCAVDVDHAQETEKIWKGVSSMTLNDSAIDYVHWDDPNELMDRLRLLDASL